MRNTPPSLRAVKQASSLGLVLTLAVCGARSTFAQGYTFQDIGTLGGTLVQGLGLNSTGQVVGYASDAAGTNHAFLYDSAGLHDLSIFPGAVAASSRTQPVSGAVAINAAGRIAGFSTANKSFNAFLHTGSGPLASSDNVGTLGGTYSQGLGINSAGVVVGSATTATSQHAFLYDGTMHDLGALGAFGAASAYGINSADQVVGLSIDTSFGGATHAFRTAPGGAAIDPATSDLGTLGGENAGAYAINNAGTVVGYSETIGGAVHGFATPTGRSIDAASDDLGVLAGFTDSYAQGINSTGLIVGYNNKGMDAGGLDISPTATLFTGGTWVDLNSFLPANFGYTLVDASAVNDMGQIVALGRDGSGGQHTFLLSPTPEPSGAALFGIGVFALGLLTARRRRVSA